MGLKWIATMVLILGTIVNSAGIYPAGAFILMFGGLLWLGVAIQWREPALIVTNSVMFLAALAGMLYRYLTLGTL